MPDLPKRLRRQSISACTSSEHYSRSLSDQMQPHPQSSPRDHLPPLMELGKNSHPGASCVVSIPDKIASTAG